MEVIGFVAAFLIFLLCLFIRLLLVVLVFFYHGELVIELLGVMLFAKSYFYSVEG